MSHVLAWVCGYSILVGNWHKENSCCEVNRSQSILYQDAFQVEQPRNYWKHSYPMRRTVLNFTPQSAWASAVSWIQIDMSCNRTIIWLVSHSRPNCFLVFHCIWWSLPGDGLGNKTESTSFAMQHKRSKHSCKWSVLKEEWACFCICCTSQTWGLCTISKGHGPVLVTKCLGDMQEETCKETCYFLVACNQIMQKQHSQ